LIGTKLRSSHTCTWNLVCIAILPIEEKLKLAQWVAFGQGCMTKILLVDDSKFLRMATERALARAGYRVITADEGRKAIELAKDETPDVILLDMLLPGMTGPDVLKCLKKDPSTGAIPVIAFTGLSHKNEERLRHDGACAYLEKSTLELDKGCDTLLNALAAILRELGLEVPTFPRAHGVASA
jgi:CheY-like chemotaxis protein